MALYIFDTMGIAGGVGSMRLKPNFIGITGLALVVATCATLGGCEADDAVAHEPHAKAQKILPEMGAPSDISYAKDQWDEKQTSQDEATNGKQ
jgi:hypothetical protein